MNLEQEQHTQIMVALGKLETGMIGINQHLAQLNGKIATQEGRLNHMDVEDGKLQGVIEALKNTDREDTMVKNKWIERGLGLLVNALVFLAILLLVRSGILNLDKEPQTLTDIQKEQAELEADAKKIHLESLKQ